MAKKTVIIEQPKAPEAPGPVDLAGLVERVTRAAGEMPPGRREVNEAASRLTGLLASLQQQLRAASMFRNSPEADRIKEAIAEAQGRRLELDPAARRDAILRFLQLEPEVLEGLQATAGEWQALSQAHSYNALSSAEWQRHRDLMNYRSRLEAERTRMHILRAELAQLVPAPAGALFGDLQRAQAALAGVPDVPGLEGEIRQLKARVATALARVAEQISTATWDKLADLARV